MHIPYIFLLVLSSLILGGVWPAAAIPWTEVGDAGALPATAQVPTGGGPLTAISGQIGPLNLLDADMYRLHIPVPGTFSATTVGTGGTLSDTQLFLFTLGGLGVYADDDILGSPRSLLPAGSPLGPQGAGDYFLLITGFNRDPVSAGGLIFPNTPRSTLFGPTGPGGGLPISGYTGLEQRGTYTINLTGAELAATAVPEPGTFLLVGSGLAGLMLLRRIMSRK